jgi:hypothetical protein
MKPRAATGQAYDWEFSRGRKISVAECAQGPTAAALANAVADATGLRPRDMPLGHLGERPLCAARSGRSVGGAFDQQPTLDN